MKKIMYNKLIVYGDSFAGPPNRFEDKSYGWVELLAKKLNIRYTNNAIAGNSLQYSVKKFIKDVTNNFIEKNDIIIFIKTDPCRLHLKYQNNNPKSATQFLNRYFEIIGKYPEDAWFAQNIKFIKWYEENKDSELLKINSTSYSHMFYNYSLCNKEILFILLDSFDYEKFLFLPDKLDNFIYPNINLFKVSSLEFNNFTYDNWTQYVKSDPRSNHLSNVNLKNLSDCLYETIINKDVSCLSYDSFEKNIFNLPLVNLKIYENYINKNLLFKSNKYIDILKNK